MYVSPNFESKEALKYAVAHGKIVTIFQPGMWSWITPQISGDISVEGPHYPEARRWSAQVTVVDGKVTKVT